jgi:citrate lyase subunit beta / citryl-CoA lyase
MLPRSYLFVPADRPERFAKALASGADLVIIDLEDAVAPADKAAARDALAPWLAGEGRAARVALRINSVDTPWFEDDLRLAAQPGVAAVVLPKAERAADLARVRAAAPQAALLPLIETALGVDRVREVANSPGVQRLLFGSIDLQLDMGIQGEGEELLMFRSQLVLASRLAQRASPVDGVCTALNDDAPLRDDALRARRLGFGGKLCIHPRQVATVNAAFSPQPEELAWAQRVVQAAEQAQGAAVAVDGKMVDKPVLLRAQALLAAAPSVQVELQSFWNRRYAAHEFVYGTEPNSFLVSVAPLLPRAGRVLCLADGEGRNSVWLAGQGHEVTALDVARVGLDKAQRLASERGVPLHTVCADVTRHPLGEAAWDAIVSIFLHLPAPARRALHRRCIAALRPGGCLVFEAYGPGQLARGTGGPPQAALLHSLDELLPDFDGCAVEHQFSGVRPVLEGSLHHGDGEVVQVVVRKGA